MAKLRRIILEFRPALYAASLLATLGCSAMNDVNQSTFEAFETQQSRREASDQISRWIPLHSSATEAVKRLREQGFECQDALSTSPGSTGATLCTLSPALPSSIGSTAATSPILWFVTITSSDGSTVGDIEVARSPKDIGD